jgi:DNA-binding NarL/FixJ family response regulator
MTSVEIVADRTLFRECLEKVLRGRTGIEVVATVGTIEHLDSLARDVDVVLVDYLSTAAQSTIRRVCGVQGGPPVVVYDVPETEHHIVECVEAGAAGIALNHDSLDDLVLAIEGALRHELYCKPRVAATLARRLRDVGAERGNGACGSTLTDRELEIVELLDKGLSNKEIARQLGIRTATVKNHVHNILSKLNVNRRGEAAAIMHGRLSSPVRT